MPPQDNGTIIDYEKREEFTDLYQEFVNSYLSTSKGGSRIEHCQSNQDKRPF